MSDDERTTRHFHGHPPGTVTAGKPEERPDGVTVWPLEVRPGDTVRGVCEPLFGDMWGTGEPLATPTVVGTREGKG